MGTNRRLTDTEFEVMSVVWDEGGEASARRIHEVLSQRGLDRAVTYQLIHRCIGKGALERIDPGFVCRSLINQGEVQVEETKRLIDKVFGGSAERLLTALVNPDSASQEEIDRLRSMVRDTFKE